MKRVFFAINLPLEVKRDLGILAQEMAPYHRNRAIRWVPESNFHITLHFLGSVTEEVISRVDRVAREVADRTPAFSLTTAGFGCFPDAARPKVLMIEARDTDHAETLVQELGQGIRQTGFPLDVRPWHAHITLGRVSDDRGACEVGHFEFTPRGIPVQSFELMESELGPGGPRYSVLQSYQLCKS